MKVHSIFTSIDGEVGCYHQGRLTTFVRLAGCNLRCTYCDTTRAQGCEGARELSAPEITREVMFLGVPKVTITGGEPLLQMDGVEGLLRQMPDTWNVHIETNGTVTPFGRMLDKTPLVMDYKLPSSQMERAMVPQAFARLGDDDWVKFVIQDRLDFDRACELVRVGLVRPGVGLAFSPVHGALPVPTLMDWMRSDVVSSRGVVNIQLHKLLDLKEDG